MKNFYEVNPFGKNKETPKETVKNTTLLAQDVVSIGKKEGLNISLDAAIKMIDQIVIIYIYKKNGNVIRGTGGIINNSLIISNKHVLGESGIAFAYKLDGKVMPLKRRLLHNNDDIGISPLTDTILDPKVGGSKNSSTTKNQYISIMPIIQNGKMGLELKKIIPGSCEPGMFQTIIDTIIDSENKNDVHYTILSQPGTSGSPIFDIETGDIIGIHKGRFGFNACGGGEKINF